MCISAADITILTMTEIDPAEHGARAVGAGERVIDGNTYVFNALGQVLINAFDDSGNFYDAKGQRIHKATIKRLIQVALQPVGSTMYVWAGAGTRRTTGAASSLQRSAFRPAGRFSSAARRRIIIIRIHDTRFMTDWTAPDISGGPCTIPLISRAGTADMSCWRRPWPVHTPDGAGEPTKRPLP